MGSSASDSPNVLSEDPIDRLPPGNSADPHSDPEPPALTDARNYSTTNRNKDNVPQWLHKVDDDARWTLHGQSSAAKPVAPNQQCPDPNNYPYNRLFTFFDIKKILLEDSCKPQVPPSIFMDALAAADPACLDDIDDTHGALVHRLMAHEGREEQTEKLVALLKEGADPNLVWNRESILASYTWSNPDGAEMLLERGADPILAGDNGINGIHAASEKNNVSILSKIESVGDGFDWDCMCEAPIPLNSGTGCDIILSECNAVYLAAVAGSEAAIHFLCSRGANVNRADKGLFRPIHAAAFCGSVCGISALHENGADLRVRTVAGMTALHFAAFFNHEKAVKKLLELDIGLYTVRDNARRVPIEYASLRDTFVAFADGLYLWKLGGEGEGHE